MTDKTTLKISVIQNSSQMCLFSSQVSLKGVSIQVDMLLVHAL